MLMGCSKGSVVRLAPSSLLCAQTGRACPGLCAWVGGYSRGPGTVRVGRWLGARAPDCARVPRTVRVGPFTGSGNPFLRSWALLVAVWAARLGYHLWG